MHNNSSHPNILSHEENRREPFIKEKRVSPLTHIQMLYPTPTPPFFSPNSPSLFSSAAPEMECSIKGGSMPEMLVSKQVVSVGGVASVSGEDFFVDQLLNLDDDDDNAPEEIAVKYEPFEEIQPLKSEKDSSFLSPAPFEIDRDCNGDDFGSVLSVPAEEADLEWLSQFVEESFLTPYPTGFGPTKPEPGSEALKAHSFTPPLSLSKSRRSKRARTGCRVWSAGLAEPVSSSSSTTTTSSSSPSSPNPAKKQRKRENGSGSSGPPRRCSHCGVQKTPQWRAGPFGAKTLCNACGVRYKSGRLLPEYRPACSPTFSSELHSNNHRKVLEMRKKKESPMAGQPDPVTSFG